MVLGRDACIHSHGFTPTAHCLGMEWGARRSSRVSGRRAHFSSLPLQAAARRSSSVKSASNQTNRPPGRKYPIIIIIIPTPASRLAKIHRENREKDRENRQHVCVCKGTLGLIATGAIT